MGSAGGSAPWGRAALRRERRRGRKGALKRRKRQRGAETTCARPSFRCCSRLRSKALRGPAEMSQYCPGQPAAAAGRNYSGEVVPANRKKKKKRGGGKPLPHPSRQRCWARGELLRRWQYLPFKRQRPQRPREGHGCAPPGYVPLSALRSTRPHRGRADATVWQTCHIQPESWR